MARLYGQLQIAIEREASVTSHVVSGVVEAASGERGFFRIFEYAGGSSIVSDSTWLARSSLGPASSCCIILTDRSRGGTALLRAAIVAGMIGVCRWPASIIDGESRRSCAETASNVPSTAGLGKRKGSGL